MPNMSSMTIDLTCISTALRPEMFSPSPVIAIFLILEALRQVERVFRYNAVRGSTLVATRKQRIRDVMTRRPDISQLVARTPLLLETSTLTFAI